MTFKIDEGQKFGAMKGVIDGGVQVKINGRLDEFSIVVVSIRSMHYFWFSERKKNRKEKGEGARKPNCNIFYCILDAKAIYSVGIPTGSCHEPKHNFTLHAPCLGSS